MPAETARPHPNHQSGSGQVSAPYPRHAPARSAAWGGGNLAEAVLVEAAEEGPGVLAGLEDAGPATPKHPERAGLRPGCRREHGVAAARIRSAVAAATGSDEDAGDTGQRLARLRSRLPTRTGLHDPLSSADRTWIAVRPPQPDPAGHHEGGHGRHDGTAHRPCIHRHAGGGRDGSNAGTGSERVDIKAAAGHDVVEPDYARGGAADSQRRTFSRCVRSPAGW